ncbi:uncharacterized protein UDID_11882 [Ustilago sp. UG-2017a]|nr:uncharacterized protein UDID_11882 [Ustilago sp. UG-2017a]
MLSVCYITNASSAIASATVSSRPCTAHSLEAGELLAAAAAAPPSNLVTLFSTSPATTGPSTAGPSEKFTSTNVGLVRPCCLVQLSTPLNTPQSPAAAFT